ncbi:MAG: PHP domain-containing protein [Erysipelotrichaceae bacterium]
MNTTLRYDLHIHSALSPCADDDMTLQNIVKMAYVAGLDAIAITDHNTVEALRYLDQIDTYGMQILCGVELTSQEEVHVLAYFSHYHDAAALLAQLEPYRLRIDNRPHYFGHQWVFDGHDELVKEEPTLLLTSFQLPLAALIERIQEHHGKVVLAHIDHPQNGILTQLGFIPNHLPYDGVEIRKDVLIPKTVGVRASSVWFKNSDAHRLVDIGTNEASMEWAQWNAFWRNTR